MEVTAVLLLAAVTWFWYDAARAREAALGFGHAACERLQLQLLDETVVCVKLRLKRNAEGRAQLWRAYVFEFTATGESRRNGAMTLLATKLESLELEPHEVM